MTPKQHYRKVMSRGKMAPVDMDRYPKRRGLEGPFRFRNGRIVYYDPKEGKYYDSETDMYLSDKETMKLHEAEDRNAGYALVGFARRVEEGSLDAMNESEEDIFTVLGPGTPVGESNSGRGFHWEAVNRKVDRLGKQMESVLSDAFDELDLLSNTDHQEAAEKMKEYLEATFNEVRDSVERYEEAAIKRSKRGSRRR